MGEGNVFTGICHWGSAVGRGVRSALGGKGSALGGRKVCLGREGSALGGRGLPWEGGLHAGGLQGGRRSSWGGGGLHGGADPPPHHDRDTVNRRSVRILLECILVMSVFAVG